MTEPIAVVEPQMEGIFHAPFNAALLHSVVLAYPGVAISFAARASHAAAVRQILSEHVPSLLSAVEWRTLPELSRSSVSGRWLYNRRVLKDVLASSEFLLFSSISRMQLGILKRLIKPHHRVRAVLHGDIEQIEHPPRESFPSSLFSLHSVFRRRHPAGLRYLLLGESIRQNIPASFRTALSNSGVIPHPYHFPPIPPAPAGPAVFGTFGNTGDGVLLASVATEVHRRNPGIALRLVGFVRDKAAVARLQPFVRDVGVDPLSRATFQERGRAVTHALWVAPAQTFRLRASGTFFDALAFGKPLVYVANPYIDFYFNQAPGIGLRCMNVADLAGAVIAVAEQHTPETYARAQAEIAVFREQFAPAAVARLLPAALDW